MLHQNLCPILWHWSNIGFKFYFIFSFCSRCLGQYAGYAEPKCPVCRENFDPTKKERVAPLEKRISSTKRACHGCLKKVIQCGERPIRHSAYLTHKLSSIFLFHFESQQNEFDTLFWLCLEELPPVDNFGTVVGENPAPYGILALWAVNSLSIVFWALIIFPPHHCKHPMLFCGYSMPRRHFWDPGQLGLWSPDFPLWFSIESPDSRVWANQGPRNVSWAVIPPECTPAFSELVHQTNWMRNVREGHRPQKFWLYQGWYSISKFRPKFIWDFWPKFRSFYTGIQYFLRLKICLAHVGPNFNNLRSRSKNFDLNRPIEHWYRPKFRSASKYLRIFFTKSKYPTFRQKKLVCITRLGPKVGSLKI